MAGTRAGGLKTAATNKKIYGEDYYARIGRMGGSVTGKSGGFASTKVGKDGLTGPERAKLVGTVGGLKSSRAGVPNKKKKADVTPIQESKPAGKIKQFFAKAFGRANDAE